VKRVALTGGTGFVGANLARRLLADGHLVFLLVRRGHADWRIAEIRADVSLHEVDLGDPRGLTATLASISPDWVFHLATYGAYPTQREPARMIQTNVVGTANLVEASLEVGVDAFVNAGSSSEYGFKDHPAAEIETLDPNSYYAVTKASASLYCRYAARSRGVRMTTLRLYSVYGPYEEPTRLIPTVIGRGLRGELPPLVSPDTARDFVEVSDVCDAFVRAATQEAQEPGAIYNVGSGTQTTVRDVVDLARKRYGMTAEPVWGSMPPRGWDTVSWVADISYIQRALGWHPQTSFEEGFERFASWLETSPEWRARYSATATSDRRQ
jgi:UDP-glucose 4-epimerase